MHAVVLRKISCTPLISCHLTLLVEVLDIPAVEAEAALGKDSATPPSLVHNAGPTFGWRLQTFRTAGEEGTEGREGRRPNSGVIS